MFWNTLPSKGTNVSGDQNIHPYKVLRSIALQATRYWMEASPHRMWISNTVHLVLRRSLWPWDPAGWWGPLAEASIVRTGGTLGGSSCFKANLARRQQGWSWLSQEMGPDNSGPIFGTANSKGGPTWKAKSNPARLVAECLRRVSKLLVVLLGFVKLTLVHRPKLLKE